MTFDEFKAAVSARWPAREWHFSDQGGCFGAYRHHRLHISWRTEVGWSVFHRLQSNGPTIPAAIRNARNAINRARKALDKEPTP